MSPDAILFDAGGTLVTIHPDTLGDLVEPLSGERPEPEAMFAAHYRAMHAIVENEGVTDRPDWWEWWLATYLGYAGVAATEETVAVLNRTSGMWRHPIPGAAEAVATIRDAGIRVGVVSNAEGHVADDLAAAGFDGLFETVIDSTRVGVRKPDPAIFSFALDSLGMAPDEVWYVGDSLLFDFGGAANAGLGEFVLVDPFGLYDHEPKVATVADLPALLGLH
jgi:putative hydrolase of the HAD superfamily